MRSFYHYMMRFRGNKQMDDEKKLADWMFEDHSFPKQATTYDEVSSYLEGHVPFPDALKTFDRLWDEYIIDEQ